MNSIEVFPVIVFDQGALVIAISVHDELHTNDPLLTIGNKFRGFCQSETICTDILFPAQYLYNCVPLWALVELLHQ